MDVFRRQPAKDGRFVGDPARSHQDLKPYVWHDERMAEDVFRGPSEQVCS